jgi:ArsR family transcriptional regulator
MKNLRLLDQPCCVPGAPPLPKKSAEALADRFKALSDPARVAIVNQLAGRGDVCTCNLTGFLGLSQPTVSHHLRVLREAGLIETSGKRGTFTFYRLVPEAMQQLAFAIGGSPAAEGAESRLAGASA